MEMRRKSKRIDIHLMCGSLQLFSCGCAYEYVTEVSLEFPAVIRQQLEHPVCKNGYNCPQNFY